MNLSSIRTAPDLKIAAYFSTRNMYDALPAAFNSLLAHTRVDHVVLFIEDDTLPFRLPECVWCVNVSGQDIFSHDGPNFRTRYSYMALMKTAMPYVFPDLDRILILDVDTIVREDISDLWNIDLSHSYYAAVSEPAMSRKLGYSYSNAGVMMLNLSLLRSTGMADNIIRELNTVRHPYPEQDTLNILCGDNFTELPTRYNVTRPLSHITGESERVSITHFAAVPYKVWTQQPLVRFWLRYGNESRRTAVFIGNRKVYGMMLDSSKSLLSHSQVDKVYFLIEDDAFPVPLPSIFTCLNVSGQTIFNPSGPNIHSYYSYMTALRAALSKLLPGEDRVLLLDPDTVTIADISPVWNYDISDYYFAAVPETRNNDHTKHPYYNAGVMLMNLARLRRDKLDDRIIHEINTTHYHHLEQDVLNFLCDPYILPLPPDYNASFVSDPTSTPRIMHFLSFAKKYFPEAAKPYHNMPWNMVPFAKQFVKE